ncbi:MAG: hypothetical protein IT462_15005 [Planctomycetes bacterium]|nr:hypothetical protein [Planctomycetota bacterium]
MDGLLSGLFGKEGRRTLGLRWELPLVVNICIFVVLSLFGFSLYGPMEVNFSNADLAAIMLRPAQAQAKAAYQAALKATLQSVKDAELALKLQQEATQLGKKIDVKA